MKYKVGDIVRQFTDDRKISWRGTVKFVGPTIPPFDNDNPALLDENWLWVVWDNGNSNRLDSPRIEFDKEYLRDIKINSLGL